MFLLTGFRVSPVLRARRKTDEICYGLGRLLGKERAGKLASSGVKSGDCVG